ncbi:MAG: HAMP domain-containing histidine kinase [Verrucomicrobiales bacterium]|nr:HAMP domain-containing histidine kinase [Verrucomicrobiales bacterium]
MSRPRTPAQRARRPSAQVVLVALQAFWLAFVIALGAWWVYLMFTQAGKIAVLEEQLGVANAATEGHWVRTQRMILWEGSTFFAALLVSLAMVGHLYWRDMRRARSLQAFFASVTHELRTPLAGIRLQAESLADLDHRDPNVRTLLERLLDDTTRLETQVDRALELARVEGGGPVLTRPLDLEQAVAQVLRHWKPPLQRAVAPENSVRDARVLADPAAVQIILRNLLDNCAWHAEGDPLRVEVSSRAASGSVVLTVRDHGKAPAAPVHAPGTLFEKGPKSRGAGVGLYLVRVLMQRMGGHAAFRCLASPTDGTGFQVDLVFQEAPHHG